jgi:hypothetical protein
MKRHQLRKLYSTMQFDLNPSNNQAQKNPKQGAQLSYWDRKTRWFPK